MAIVNTLAHTASYTGGTVRTYSVTVPAGDDRILFVTHANDDPTVSGGFSVTFDGVALTKLAGNGANTSGMAVYYLVNPAVGAHDLVWTNSSTYTSGLFGEYVFTGVGQTTPLGTPFTLFQPYVSSSTSASFTSVEGGVIFSFAQISQTTSVVQTPPADLLTSNVYSIWTIGAAKSQPGATSIGWQGWGADKQVNHIAVMMYPSASTHEITISNSVQTNTVSDVAIDNAVAGTHNITISSAQQANILSAAIIQQAVVGSGTITTPEIRDWETRNLKTGLTGVQVDVRSIETGALLVRKTGLTSHATTAVCTITDAAVPNATLCEVMMRCPDGSKGVWDLMSV